MPRRLKPVRSDRAELEKAIGRAEQQAKDYARRARAAASTSKRWMKRRDALRARLAALPQASMIDGSSAVGALSVLALGCGKCGGQLTGPGQERNVVPVYVGRGEARQLTSYAHRECPTKRGRLRAINLEG